MSFAKAGFKASAERMGERIASRTNPLSWADNVGACEASAVIGCRGLDNLNPDGLHPMKACQMSKVETVRTVADHPSAVSRSMIS